MTTEWSSEPAIRALVQKIIASRTLSRSGRLARFLEFTVRETLAGNANQLKEFVIGVEVFDRSQDYDPRLDPIVRVEARRLRMKLRKYYETEGRDDRIRIEIPKGGYVPAISPSRPEDRADARKSPDGRRAIAVLPFLNAGPSEECEGFVHRVAEELIGALIKMDGWRVVAWSSPLKQKGTPRDYARIGNQLGVDAVLEGTLRAAADGTIKVAAQLIDVRDGSYLWAESWERSRAEMSSAGDDIASGLARAMGGDQARIKLSCGV